MTILDRILSTKRDELRERREAVPLATLEAAVVEAPAPQDFAESLGRRTGAPRIIAEVKRASPSKGLIREDFDPVAIAEGYSRGGAAGISVLTDEQYFQGRLEYLRSIRRAVATPLLRKDFVIDPYQVWEARAAGADAILLILAALDDGLLRDLTACARELGMEILFEVHDRSEIDRLLPLEPRVVGINNRNLRTFEVSLETTRDLLPLLPAGTVSVSESGFSTGAEISRMARWGVDAFLIGESLMRAPDPGRALASLLADASSDEVGE